MRKCRFLLAVLGIAPAAIGAQARDTTQLDTVAVTAKRPSISPRIREFEDRRNRWVGGVFVTRGEIVKRHPAVVTDLFRGISSLRLVHIDGVKLMASTRGLKVNLNPPQGSTGSRSDRFNRAGLVDCILRTGVDGMVMERGYDMNLLVPEDIEGIEIFQGSSSIPSKYTGMSGDKGCGLIMIWTRTGENR